MSALLIDLDGVVYQGNAAVPGAPEVLQELARRRVPHLFVTNTTSQPRAAIVEKLAGFGIGVPAERILTPPVAAVRWLERHANGAALLCVPEATRADFSELEIAESAEVAAIGSVVIGDLATEWTFERLNATFRVLMRPERPRCIALGLTRYWRTPRGLQLDVGPFVKALEYATGREAVVLGKPSCDFFTTALDLLGARPEDTMMIGDDIVGDIDGAQRAGLRGVLVRTGKFRAADLEGRIQPDLVLDSLAHVTDHL
jgi:HAD superfamily hydrolase (TIGR01458 family)